MYVDRPTKRELLKKLKSAKRAILNGNVFFANLNKALGELNNLDSEERQDVWELIITLLDEITEENYRGARPPQRSYEKNILGCELFAFSWFSEIMGMQMYIKFVIKNERYGYVSLHKCNSHII